MDEDTSGFRFLFTADSHIKSRTWTNSTALEGDAYRALETLLDSTPQDVSDLVVGGDWFDSNRPSSADVAESARFMSRFSRVWYIRGNHDCAEPPWIDSLTGHAIHVSATPALMSDNVWICGLDWSPSADTLKSGLSDIAKAVQDMTGERSSGFIVYVLLHTSIKEFLGFDGSYKLTMKELSDMFRGLPVRVLVGDVHIRRTIAADEPGFYVHSPGALYPLSSDQMLSGNAAGIITASSGDIQDVPVNVRHYARVRWEGREALDEAVRRAVSASADAGFVLPSYIRVDVPADADVAIPAGIYQPEAVVHLVRENEDSIQHAAAEMQDSDSMMEDAVRDVTSYDQDVQDMAVALLAADDPVATLDGWLKFWGVVKGC